MSITNCIINICNAQNDDTNVTTIEEGYSSLFECILYRTTNDHPMPRCAESTHADVCEVTSPFTNF